MQPKFYEKKEHQIDKLLIDNNAIAIILKLQKAGFESYLVGGGVRDLILGHTPKDFDISTSAKPEEIKALFKRRCLLIGKRFRLAHIRFGKKIFEVSTFRSGETDSDQLITVDNIWGTPEEDALRRDFTINGLFYCPKKEIIIDYVNGFEDLNKQMLCCIGLPHVRFKQDPVRMIRLLKFEARFGLQVEESLKVALLEHRHEIIKSAPPRVLEEILRMLESSFACKFIYLMSTHGLIQSILPGLSDFLETQKGGLIYDYLQEIDYIIKEHPSIRFPRPVVIASLIYPIIHERILNIIQKKPPHLGTIYREITNVINDVFYPYLTLPKKLRSSVINIIHNQYRLTPLDKKGKRKKIPTKSDFLLSLKFLNLRYRLNPELKPFWEYWSQTFYNQKKMRR